MEAQFALPPLIIPQGCERLLVALSGGVDSIALLHWLKAELSTRNTQLPLSAIHINHQLSPHATQWQQHVENVCDQLGVALIVKVVSVTLAGNGLEQAARTVRYTAFEEELKSDDFLVLGHHQMDQVETFFLRLMRGAGIQGLIAMPILRPLGKGYLWRPWLGCSKTQIVDYANRHQLVWVEDESNQNPRFSRNFLRRTILPSLLAHWPQGLKKINDSLEHLKEVQTLLDDYAEQDFQTLCHRPEKLGESIDLTILQSYSWARQKLLVRFWLKRLDLLAPESRHFDELKKLFLAREDAKPALWLADYGFGRFKQRLYLLPRYTSVGYPGIDDSGDDADQVDGGADGFDKVEGVDAILFTHACQLPDGSTLQVCGYDGDLRVRFRQGGERAHPEGRQHSQSLKRLLQEYAVPLWLRPHIPLVYQCNKLIAVGDFWLEQGARETCGLALTDRLSLTWTLPTFKSPR
jgi:tRNA(Ile)-lysidine synthase